MTMTIMNLQVSVSLLTSSLLLASSAAQEVPGVPGLQAWRQAQSRVREAEQRLTGGEAAIPPVTSVAGVPGLEQWRAHQAAALQAERQLEAGEAVTEVNTEVNTVTSSTSSEKAPTAGKQAAGLNELRSLLQTSIKKFLSKTKQRKEERINSDDKSSKILSLLSKSKKSKKKPTTRASYLDQLIQSYKSDSSERDNIVRDFEFLTETPRSRGPLTRIELFDDPYVSRSRSLYQEDIEEALIESELLDRELKKMLRKLQSDF